MKNKDRIQQLEDRIKQLELRVEQYRLSQPIVSPNTPYWPKPWTITCETPKIRWFTS